MSGALVESLATALWGVKTPLLRREVSRIIPPEHQGR